MTPADRERIEAACLHECQLHGFGVRGPAIAACRNTAMAAHELGRESALGEIETALRELGARVTIMHDGTEWHVCATVDAQSRTRRDATLGDALLAAIDAVNEMREGQALLASKAGG
jgi:tRNA A-37 threonylcarbamoyl transferase component Bud32